MFGNLKKNGEKIKAIIPIVCAVDVLLLPYIRFLSCSLAMLLVLGWSVYHFRSYFKNGKEIVGAVFFIVASHLVGFFAYHTLGGVSTSVIVIFAMLLFYYLKTVGVKVPIREILLVYLLVAFVFGIIYLIDPKIYFTVRSFWTMSGQQIDFTQHTMSRFTFIFSDPNNAACALVGILAYLLLFEDIKSMPMVMFSVVSVIVCVVITFSVSGMAMLIFALVVLTIMRAMKKPVYNISVMLLSVGIALLVLWIASEPWATENVVFDTVTDRVEVNTQDASMGGRTDIWMEIITKTFSWFNLLIGKGAVMDSAAVVYKPHSGLLYFLVAYGLPAAILTVMTFFDGKLLIKKPLQYLIVLAPFGAILLINTGLSDYRFMSSLALITAAMSNKIAESQVDAPQTQMPELQ